MNAELVAEYRSVAAAQQLRAESVTRGYVAESASYFGSDGEGDAVERRVTLKDFMRYEADRVAYERESAEVWADARDPWESPATGDPAAGIDLLVLWRSDLEELVRAGSLLAKAELARRVARRPVKRAARAARRLSA